MSVLRVAITAASVAMAVAHHPLVRAGLRAAPHVITPAMRDKASDAALGAAYRAGTLARKMISRK